MMEVHIYGIYTKLQIKTRLARFFISLNELGINEYSTVITMIEF